VCHLLALLGSHPILQFSRILVKASAVEKGFRLPRGGGGGPPTKGEQKKIFIKKKRPTPPFAGGLGGLARRGKF